MSTWLIADHMASTNRELDRIATAFERIAGSLEVLAQPRVIELGDVTPGVIQ